MVAVPAIFLLAIFPKADDPMRSVVRTASPTRRAEGFRYLASSARHQGHLRDALTYARESDRANHQANPDAGTPAGGLAEAQALQKPGRGREAVVIFERIARWNPSTMPAPDVAPSMLGLHRAWNFMHAAVALASAGDTATLAARADTTQYYGKRSIYKLHRELHHHVRGLLLVARAR